MLFAHAKKACQPARQSASITKTLHIFMDFAAAAEQTLQFDYAFG
jgi:hypothetical protein